MIHLDYRDSRPIYEQVKDSLRRLMVTGVLAPGDKLPSVRSMASQLSINPNTIQRAYRQLEMEGWIATVPGKGCFVCGEPMLDPREELRLLHQFENAAKKLMGMGYTAQELIQKLTEEDSHAGNE